MSINLWNGCYKNNAIGGYVESYENQDVRNECYFPYRRTLIEMQNRDPTLFGPFQASAYTTHNGQRFNLDGHIPEVGQRKSIPRQQVQANMVATSMVTTTSECCSVDPNTENSKGNAPLTATTIEKQPSKRNRDPRLVARSSAARPSIPVAPNLKEVMVQPNNHVASGRPVHNFEIVFNKGKAEILSYSITNPAAKAISNPSEGKKGKPRDTVQSLENGNTTTAKRIFKNSLINFVKEGLKEAWHGGRLTKEIYKVIVKKAVEKIMNSEKNIPDTKQRVGSYMKLNKKKIERLIQEYLGRYTNVPGP